MPPPDVEAVARAWHESDRRGRAFGPLSVRDTTRGRVDGAEIMVDYGRPAKRGRVIWGGVVPWNKVWRLGADMATHFATTVDLDVGGTTVPAGRYTLWMLPREDSTFLIVNTQTNIFGTMYNPARNLARIPLTRQQSGDRVERLTLEVVERSLVIRWDDMTFRVPLEPRRRSEQLR